MESSTEWRSSEKACQDAVASSLGRDFFFAMHSRSRGKTSMMLSVVLVGIGILWLLTAGLNNVEQLYIGLSH